ncbi:MAG: hypothetical protein NTZ74_06830 [Chloroflexi bacterium]|nr:hypothetical protein [Chloroflexota bacterium]
MLWVIEISFNNFIAHLCLLGTLLTTPFVSIIAFSILTLSFKQSYQKDSLVHGIEIGLWNGFVSGRLACSMGLFVIVFGMHYILQDSLNVSEWVGREIGSTAPNMAAYFAFETFAGAFCHLIILGIAMGGLLCVICGSAGKFIKLIVDHMKRRS